jgi:hypothetical protein
MEVLIARFVLWLVSVCWPGARGNQLKVGASTLHCHKKPWVVIVDNGIQCILLITKAFQLFAYGKFSNYKILRKFKSNESRFIVYT